MFKTRLACSFAALMMATSVPAADLDLTNMTDAQRDAFGAQVREYLLSNPEVIMEAVQVLEARQAEEQAQGDLALVKNHADALFNDGYSWVGGNPDGDVTIVEFFDYRCGFCRRAHPEVKELVESDGNIRYVAKEFPILGENSVISARFALAAREVAGDDAYLAAKEALIALNSELQEPVLLRLAETLGLDGDAVIAAMDSDVITDQLAQTRALAQQLQISGTPSFVMGGQMIRGYLPLDAKTLKSTYDKRNLLLAHVVAVGIHSVHETQIFGRHGHFGKRQFSVRCRERVDRNDVYVLVRPEGFAIDGDQAVFVRS